MIKSGIIQSTQYGVIICDPWYVNIVNDNEKNDKWNQMSSVQILRGWWEENMDMYVLPPNQIRMPDVLVSGIQALGHPCKLVPLILKMTTSIIWEMFHSHVLKKIAQNTSMLLSQLDPNIASSHCCLSIKQKLVPRLHVTNEKHFSKQFFSFFYLSWLWSEIDDGIV